MSVFEFDPLTDPRWVDFVERHPRASVFHTTAWLATLADSYGYTPVAFTTSPAGHRLANAVLCCEVRSWLTGRRLVSLPFSDHCDPLVEGARDLDEICGHLEAVSRTRGWRYIELRPKEEGFRTAAPFSTSECFWFHHLELPSDAGTVWRSFNKDSVQRKIRRARRERLAYAEGRSEDLIRTFYGLLLITRRRHQLPPQPMSWFRHLARHFGASMKIRIASSDRHPVAAILTLTHRKTTVYKYGCSDAGFHQLGGMHFLLWRTIQDACVSGHTTVDLGRCDIANEGLATFKDRFGATRSSMTYARYPPRKPAGAMHAFAAENARRLFGCLPAVCRVAAGRLLYRHAA